MITVYVKPPGIPCPPCEYTIKFLVDNGIPHKTIVVYPDGEAMAELKRRGVMEAPFVLTSHDSWSGYRREKLKTLLTTKD